MTQDFDLAQTLYSLSNLCLEILGDRPEIGQLNEVSTDSRAVAPNDLFVALNGENHRGIKFAEQALEKEAKLIICEGSRHDEYEYLKNLSIKFPESCFYIVEDSLDFFHKLASVWLQNWKALRAENYLISLTGSNGKTTTKEILNKLLEGLIPNKILSTSGNLNNQFGVPMTIMRLKKEHQVALIEVGTNSPGEIEALAELIRPEAGLITNIGPAHLEKLIDLEGVYNEKISLYKSYSRNPNKRIFVVSEDDEYLSRLCCKNDVESFRRSRDAELEESFYFISQEEISFKVFGYTYKIHNPTFDTEYIKFNLINSLCLMSHLYPNELKKLNSLANKMTMKQINRGGWIKKSQTNIYLDAYNANPASMRVGLKAFVERVKKEGPKDEQQVCLVLGDMNELGENSSEFHEQVGRELKELLTGSGLSAAKVYFVGQFAEAYFRGYKKNSFRFDETEALLEDKSTQDDLLNTSFLFLKASRSLQLERLLDIFE